MVSAAKAGRDRDEGSGERLREDRRRRSAQTHSGAAAFETMRRRFRVPRSPLGTDEEAPRPLIVGAYVFVAPPALPSPPSPVVFRGHFRTLLSPRVASDEPPACLPRATASFWRAGSGRAPVRWTKRRVC